MVERNIWGVHLPGLLKYTSEYGRAYQLRQVSYIFWAGGGTAGRWWEVEVEADLVVWIAY